MDEHARTILEDIQRSQRLLAEGLQATNQKLDAFRVETVRRFDELDHRMIAMDVKHTTRIDTLDEKFTKRLDGIDGRLDGIDGRLDGIDGRLDGIDGRLDGVEGRLEGGKPRQTRGSASPSKTRKRR